MSEVDIHDMESARRVVESAVADERVTLEAFLDFYRDALLRKIAGLSEEDARRRLVDSQTTIAGLVKHLRIIEMNWFQRILAQTPDDELPVMVTWEDPHSTFTCATFEGNTQIVTAYRHQCELSREIAHRHQLSDDVPHPELGRVSLRWIYIHMIDETARHVGHADILREQIDGQTGV
jgi:uncharacterized damage-inducible protein DinB